MEQPGEKMALEEELYRIGIAFLAAGVVAAYIALKWILPVLPVTECVFWRMFGLYCPGCGGTRAFIEFLHGHFLQSVWYHPIVMYTAVVFGWFMLSHTLEKLHVPGVRGMRYRAWHLYGALALIVVNCIVRNAMYLLWGIPI